MAGVLEAVTRAMGGILNELGGLRFTRAIMPAAAGATSINVETTFEWPVPGVAYIKGQPYIYTGTTPTALTGLSYFEGVTEVIGLREDIDVTEEVLDFSRMYSDLDLLRATFFVNTAVGDDLSILGRNLGVDRPPTLTDDDVFREIIKALAYVPKGTMFALEIALTAFFGAGNFRIWENLLNFNNTVFIQLTAGALALTQSSIGKTFMGIDIPLPLDDAAMEITLPEASLLGSFASATLEDEVQESDLSAVFPTAITEIRYTGDAGIPVWVFDDLGTGTSEGAEVTSGNAAGGGSLLIDLLGTPADRVLYRHRARVQPESEAYLDAHMSMMAIDNAAAMAFVLRIEDGARILEMGFLDDGGGNMRVGASSGAAFVDGFTVFPQGPFDTYAIRKNPDGTVELLRNGNVFQTVLDPTVFAATVETEFGFGVESAANSCEVNIKSVNYFAHTDTDYWNTRGTGADVVLAQPTTLDTNSGALIAADEGNAIRIFGSQVTNPEGGTNNFRGVVETVLNADEATITGLTKPLAFVESAHVARVTAAADPVAFRYPDDQGHTLEILGGGPNAGDVLITHVLDPVTGIPFGGVIEEDSDQVLVVGAATGNSGVDGAVNTAQGDRFIDAVYNAFVVGDIGRLILIPTAGIPGNVGVFQITNVISTSEVEVNSISIGQPFTTEASITWEMRETTGYVTESGLDYRLKPSFVTELGTLSFELSDTGSVAGVVATLRDNPPFNFATIELIMRVRYTMVLSAQLIPNENIPTEYIAGTDPPEYTNYPFFMPANVLGAFEDFLDELTVAGVIPELIF